jgi:hypothetical protein
MTGVGIALSPYSKRRYFGATPLQWLLLISTDFPLQF